MLLLVASISLTTLGIEGAGRLVATLTSAERGMSFDSELGWRPIANIRKLGASWGVERPASTNSKGWRDREHDYDKPSGVRRVVVLGDSYAFGQSVDDGERFSDLLAERSDRLEIINLAVHGYGTDQELRVLEIEGLRYDPDIVILTIFPGNDLLDIRYELRHSWPKPVYTLQRGELQLRKPSLDWLLRIRLASYLAEFAFQRVTGVRSHNRMAPAWETTDAFPLFAALLRKLNTRVATQGAKLLALLACAEGVPLNDASIRSINFDADWAATHAAIVQLLEREAISLLDTCELFSLPSNRDEDGESLYSDDGHWNQAGHGVVADAVASWLEVEE